MVVESDSDIDFPTSDIDDSDDDSDDSYVFHDAPSTHPITSKTTAYMSERKSKLTSSHMNSSRMGDSRVNNR